MSLAYSGSFEQAPWIIAATLNRLIEEIAARDNAGMG
jgi:hypothetical protein